MNDLCSLSSASLFFKAILEFLKLMGL